MATMPARLHHERVAGPAAARWLLLTHGIYGAGGNLRRIAHDLVAARPDWGVVLVDLRQHGRSERGEPPNTLAACAGDIGALLDEIAIDALAGHSFGGKVVLATRALAPARIRQFWMLDATPSANTDPSGSVMDVLELLERLPRRWPRRDDFVAAVIAAGQTPELARWLAMNVVPDGAGDGDVALRLDLGAMREMLADYHARDLWSVALDPALPGEVELVIADRSGAVSAQDRARLATTTIHVHHVDAGHWLHVEAPAAVVALFAQHLP